MDLLPADFPNNLFILVMISLAAKRSCLAIAPDLIRVPMQLNRLKLEWGAAAAASPRPPARAIDVAEVARILKSA